jgi:dTMP kinase
MDAAGKNTQMKLLAERLTRASLMVHCYSFPRYETPLGQVILRHLKNEVSMADKTGNNINEDALVFQCMMTADKYAVAGVISAAQRSRSYENIVIADRWTQSAICYGTSDGLPAEWLISVQESLPKPDLNILLDLPFEKGWERRPERRDRYEKNADKMREIEKRYRDMWMGNHGASWVIVDASPPVEVVAKSVLDAVLGALARLPINR